VQRPDLRSKLIDIYSRLFSCFGPQHWWPGETPFEIIVGAILTQSASWHNVEIAITSLKQAGVLSPEALREIPLSDLARYIHSSGYYNAKAKKLKALVGWLGNYSDNLDKAFAGDLDEKRSELLDIYGIGPETADSILLYAGGKAAFVIDAYTKRVMERIGMASPNGSYEAHQKLFTSNLRQDVRLYNEYHALLVKLSKNVCRKRPLCADCCLSEKCDYGREHG
jgi:endonuclease-3 related protein